MSYKLVAYSVTGREWREITQTSLTQATDASTQTYNTHGQTQYLAV